MSRSLTQCGIVKMRKIMPIGGFHEVRPDEFPASRFWEAMVPS
jgi:hypothetical protein